MLNLCWTRWTWARIAGRNTRDRFALSLKGHAGGNAGAVYRTGCERGVCCQGEIFLLSQNTLLIKGGNTLKLK